MDALNGLVALDREQYEQFKKMAPHMGALDYGSPRKFSRIMALHSPTIAMISNWMYRDKVNVNRFELPPERYTAEYVLNNYAKDLEV